MGRDDRHRPPRQPARCAVITISSTRQPKDDERGAWLRERVTRAGHEVAHYSVVAEEAGAVRTAVQTLVHGRRVDVVLTVGSTGVGRQACAVDAVTGLLESPLPGFGELLRSLSFRQVGSASMFTRAVAGRVGHAFVFCLPGAPDAVALAWEQLIEPQLDHMVAMLRA